MKNFNKNDIFILSSSCKLTKGAKRSILVDYLRNEIHVISNEYYDLILMLNRKHIVRVIKLIRKESIGYFLTFIDFMLKNDFGMIINDLNQFPEITTELNDENIILKDCIIEIDEKSFEEVKISETVNKIDKLLCDDLQIRFLSSVSFEFVDRILRIINNTDIFYVEIHCAIQRNVSQEEWFFLIEKYAMLSNIFIYDSGKNTTVEFIKNSSNNAPLQMGKIYYLKTKLESKNCGIIVQGNLMFNDVNMHYLLKKYNGCLYKKLTIDRNGNIKNCPYTKNKYGNINDVDLFGVIKSEKFQKLSFIKKDDIEVCKDCEFRYNCTDCRAFLSKKNNIYSKPLKCKYNPYTAIWK